MVDWDGERLERLRDMAGAGMTAAVDGVAGKKLTYKQLIN